MLYNSRNTNCYCATVIFASKGLTFIGVRRRVENGVRERKREPSAINGTCRGTQSTYLSMYIDDAEHNGDLRFQNSMLFYFDFIHALSDSNGA